MKKLIEFEKEIIEETLKAGASLVIDGSDLKLQIGASMPIEKIAEPMFKVIDSAIDKIEKLIPGDQTALAATLKAEARAELVKLLSE